MRRRRLKPAELPSNVLESLKELESMNSGIYSGLSEDYKVAALAFSEVVRSRAEALIDFVRIGRRVNHRIPVRNEVEVYGVEHRAPDDVAAYLFWLGVEAGIQMLAGRLYGLMTGGRFRCFKDERHPTRVKWESDGGLMMPPANMVRDTSEKAPPYLPPLLTNEAFHGAAKYLGIPEEVFTRRGLRRDDAGGVIKIPEPVKDNSKYDDKRREGPHE